MGPDLRRSLWRPGRRRGVRPLRFLLLPALLLWGCGGGSSGEDDGTRAEPLPDRADSPRSSAASVGEAHGSFPLQLVDAAGDTISFTAPPQRVLSLVPSASQVLLALGAGRHLVGRTDFDSARSLAHLPSVGGGLSPNLEAVVALEPELVIRFAGESDPRTPQRLDDLGIRHLAVRPDGLQDIRRTIRHLGMLTGREGAADSILDAMDRDLMTLRHAVAEHPPLRVAYVLGGNPPWVAGPGSYLHELLELAGGVNVFSDLEGLYGPVSVEAFLVLDVDLILAPEGAEIGLPDMSVPIRRVPSELEIPGPDLARQAWVLARALHPGIHP